MELFYKDENGEFQQYNGIVAEISIPDPTADDLSSENSISNKELSDMTLTEISEVCRKHRNTIALCLGCPIHTFCDKYFGRHGATASPKYWPLDK